MARIGETLSLDTLPAPVNYEALVAGNYVVEITDSDVVDTKSGLGSQMKLTLRVIEGEYEGRLIWANIMVRHQNEMAQRIGQQCIASLISAAGIGPIDDTVDLHGIPIIAKVAIEVDKSGQYEPRNVVKGFLPYGDSALKAAPAPKSVATPARGTAPIAPWKQR